MGSARGLDDSRLRTIPHQVVRHERVGSLEEAAALRGVETSAIIKTIVVRRGEDDHLFVLVPGNRVIAWPKLRGLLGARRLSTPDAEDALAITGYAQGTITPFGASRSWPVIADERIAHGTVSIGGGAPGVAITIDGAILVTVLGATVADVTEERS